MIRYDRQLIVLSQWRLGLFLACVHAKSFQLCLTLWDAMDCSPPGSSVHGILLARILEWVDVSLLQGIFLNQGSNPRLFHLLHWQAGSLPLALPGKPGIVSYIELNHWNHRDHESGGMLVSGTWDHTALLDSFRINQLQKFSFPTSIPFFIIWEEGKVVAQFFLLLKAENTSPTLSSSSHLGE